MKFGRVWREDHGQKVAAKGGGFEWRVKAEAHVMLRLRRHFAKAQTFGEVSLSDTTDVARDLEWFLIRHPLDISDEDAAYLKTRAQAHRDHEFRIEQVLSGTYVPPEFELAIPARDYQRVGAAMMLESRGMILADELGVGKSATAICMFTRPETLPALVVAPPHLLKQWQAELKRFAPKLLTHILTKGTPYDLTFFGRLPDVILSTYHKLSGWAETLQGRVATTIFDEGQELRLRTSAKYAAATCIAHAATWRAALTGTPIFNYGAEIWNILEVLNPGALGTISEFGLEWCGGEREAVKDPRALGAFLRREGLMLRRTRTEVGREIPPVSQVIHEVDCDAEPLVEVKSRATELARLIMAQGPMDKGAKLHASEELSYLLRQATGIAKMPHVAAFIRLLLDSEERVLVFLWHRACYDLLMEQLADFNPVMYSGSETVAQKERSKQAFIGGDARVMLMSLRAGVGLDGLQKVCRTVVVGELDWSPGVLGQNVGRVARDGQPDPVMAYYLVTDSGADPVMMDVLGLKKPQGVLIVDPEAALIQDLEVDHGRVKRLAEDYLARHGSKGYTSPPDEMRLRTEEPPMPRSGEHGMDH